MYNHPSMWFPELLAARQSQPRNAHRQLQTTTGCLDLELPPHSTRNDIPEAIADPRTGVKGLGLLTCPFILLQGGLRFNDSSVCSESLGNLGFEVDADYMSLTGLTAVSPLQDVCGRSCAQLQGSPCADLQGFDAIAAAGRTDDLCDCYVQSAMDKLGKAPVSTRCRSLFIDMCGNDTLGDFGYTQDASDSFCAFASTWGDDDHVPQLTELPGNFYLYADLLLAEAAPMCRVDWFVGFPDPSLCDLSLEQNIFWTWYEFEFPRTGFHMKLLEQMVDGATTCAVILKGTSADLYQLGLSVGEAVGYKSWIDTYVMARHADPPGSEFIVREMAYTYHPYRPVNISVSLVLHSLSELDEMSYTFAAMFTLVESWEDDRIDVPCNGYGRDGETDPTDMCEYFWKPQFSFANNLMTEEGGFEVLEDQGFFAEPGADTPWSVHRNKHLRHSLAYRVKRIRATMLSPMGFYYFPFDCQNLIIRLVMSSDLPRDTVRFSTQARIGPALRSYSAALGEPEAVSLLSGWNVTGIHHQERPFHARGELYDGSATATSTDPLTSFVSNHENGVVIEATRFEVLGMQVGGTPAETETFNIPYWRDVSEAVFVVQVERVADTCLTNFVVLVALLIGLAFVSFFMPTAELGSRLDVTLTVFLGVIFFQIMIAEKLPTGVITIMHRFMYLSSVTNACFAVSHVAVYALNSWKDGQLALMARARRIRRSQRQLDAVIKLQRAFRRHHSRMRAKKLSEKAAAAAAAAAATGPARASGLTRRSLHRGASPGSSRCRCVAATSPAAANTSTTPMAAALHTLSEVDVSVEPSTGHRTHDVEAKPAAPALETPPPAAGNEPAAMARAMSVTQHLQAGQLEIKYSRATRRLSYRMKDTMRRSLVQLVILFNQLSFVALAAVYFIFVTWYLLYRKEGLDGKCLDPWLGVDAATL